MRAGCGRHWPRTWAAALAQLALCLWLGSAAVVPIVAATAFGVTRAYAPLLEAPNIADEVLAERSPEVLAGAIVGRVLDRLAVVQGGCAVVIALAGAGSWILGRCRRRQAGSRLANGVATIGLTIAALSLAISAGYIGPAVHESRAAMYAPDRPADQRATARQRFDRLHQLSETLGGVMVVSLAAAALAWPRAWPTARTQAVPGNASAGPAD